MAMVTWEVIMSIPLCTSLMKVPGIAILHLSSQYSLVAVLKVLIRCWEVTLRRSPITLPMTMLSTPQGNRFFLISGTPHLVTVV